MAKELQIGTLLHLPNMREEQLRELKAAGLEAVQLSRAYQQWLHGEEGQANTAASMKMLKDNGLDCVSLFLAMPPETRGDGFVPEDCRTTRMLFALRQMLWAKKQGIHSISCHAGSLSAVPQGPAYSRLISDFRQVLHFAEEEGLYFLFETGPESVADMKRILCDIGSPNAGVNFDPANLLIYNQDEPALMVEELSPYIKMVHCKDGVRPSSGESFGHEAPFGKGGTNIVQLLHSLLDKGYRGPLIFEQERPYCHELLPNVVDAVALLRSIRKEYLAGE